MPLLPIYGGFATTASYRAASISACRTSGAKRPSASDSKMSWLVASLSCFSPGSFAASPCGTWISEPKVVACSKQPLQFREVTGRKPVVGQLHALSQPLRIEPLAVHQYHHVELYTPFKEPPIISPPLHHQCKARELRRPPVDVEAEEVLFQDQLSHIPLAIAALQVDGLEQIISFHQDVPGATGRVDEGQRLGVERAGRDGRKLRFDLVGLLGGLDVVVHLLPN